MRIWSFDPCDRSKAVVRMISTWPRDSVTHVLSMRSMRTSRGYLSWGHENEMALTRRQFLIVLLLSEAGIKQADWFCSCWSQNSRSQSNYQSQSCDRRVFVTEANHACPETKFAHVETPFSLFR